MLWETNFMFREFSLKHTWQALFWKKINYWGLWEFWNTENGLNIQIHWLRRLVKSISIDGTTWFVNINVFSGFINDKKHQSSDSSCNLIQPCSLHLVCVINGLLLPFLWLIWHSKYCFLSVPLKYIEYMCYEKFNSS